jgi:dTDP-4-amino-4,6-dideoxygalactose transaminase
MSKPSWPLDSGQNWKEPDVDNSYIPFHVPCTGAEELRAIQRVLESNWLTTGPATQTFEREFAGYIGVKHAVAVNSGTAALQLALSLIGLQGGDEVLVPTFTFTATAEVLTYFGARPVLCDSIAGGFNIDAVDASSRVTSKTKAIIPVHIAGEPCRMDAIHELASSYGLHVIEDGAHALPASFLGRRIGAVSDLTAFSFYATKSITTGEGGMLVTGNDAYADMARCLRLHGISGDAWKRYAREGSWYYEVLHAGFKLNLPDILGALGSAQLKKSDRFWERRTEIARQYCERFEGLDELEVPPAAGPGCEHAWHLFILRLRPEALNIGRNEFVEELKKRGIGASVHFIPLHLHSYYADTYDYRRGDFPNAEDAYSRCLSLPIYPRMNDAAVERVIRAVEQVVISHRRESFAIGSHQCA